MSKLLWLDLETTGLDPYRDLVLEVAVIVTTEHLHPLAQYQAVVKQDMAKVDQRLTPYVRNMHTSNGLLKEVPKGEDPEQVAADLFAICMQQQLFKGQSRYPALLAGASVHFDRGFLKRFAPDMERNLHHRHFDVSTMRQAVNRWGSGYRQWPYNDNHRAMGDVQDSIAQAEIVRQVIRGS